MVSLTIEERLLTLRFLAPYGDDDERDYLAALDTIGEREAPFALLTMFGGGRKLSQAGERAQALWFKATRRQISERCFAVAIVRPDANKTMETTFRKLWPMPLAVFQAEEDARRFLSSNTPSS